MDEVIEQSPPTELDGWVRERVAGFFSQVPFNRELELKLERLDAERIEISLPLRERFVGHFVHGNLHGGVISTALDVAGGMMALAGTWHRLARENAAPEEVQARFLRLGTIDLRIDYLRPGQGEHFLASASLLRSGNKVAVTRMELHNDRGILLAVGTGTYLCG